MDRQLIYCFWNCGDDQIIQFAVMRAHLNKREKDVLFMVLDDCMTQEQAAEALGYSTRRVQEFWYNAVDKLLHIPWVLAYAMSLRE